MARLQCSGAPGGRNVARRVALIIASLPLGVCALRIDWSCCDVKYEEKTVTQGTPIQFALSTKGTHNVWEFANKNSYDTCNFNGARYFGGTATAGGQPISVDTLDAGRTRYFASRDPGACTMDEWPQKVAVFVEQSVGSQGGDQNTLIDGLGGDQNTLIGGQGGDQNTNTGGQGGTDVGTGTGTGTQNEPQKPVKVKFEKKKGKRAACKDVDQDSPPTAEGFLKSVKQKKYKGCEKTCIKMKGKCQGYFFDGKKRLCHMYSITMKVGIKQERIKGKKKQPVVWACGVLKVPKVKSPSLSVGRPVVESTFDKYEGSRCPEDLLGMIVTSAFVENCEDICGRDGTCKGFEFSPEDGGRCKLLAEEPQRGGDAPEGHVCAARMSTNS